MRSDMAKVIVERPRRGGQYAKKGRPPRELEDLPKRKGLRRAARELYDWKMLNENLAPLRRYLHSQVGRPWDKVWSEICANLRVTSTVQQHVRDHVFDFVAVRGVHLRDEEVFVLDRWGGPEPLETSLHELWVDPRSGILRKNRHNRVYRGKQAEARRRHERHLRQRMVAAAEFLQYHLLDDGVWWEVTLAPVPTVARRYRIFAQFYGTHQVEVPVTDVVLNAKLSALRREVLYDRRGVYGTAKRPLSKKEIKHLGLHSTARRRSSGR